MRLLVLTFSNSIIYSNYMCALLFIIFDNNFIIIIRHLFNMPSIFQFSFFLFQSICNWYLQGSFFKIILIGFSILTQFCWDRKNTIFFGLFNVFNHIAFFASIVSINIDHKKYLFITFAFVLLICISLSVILSLNFFFWI